MELKMEAVYSSETFIPNDFHLESGHIFPLNADIYIYISVYIHADDKI
jgi:hypothetical protein